MSADHWQTKENAEFLRELGFFHGLMRLNSGDAVLKDTTFSDGTIEFDVNTVGPRRTRNSLPSARREITSNSSISGLMLNCPAFRACIQYAPQTHGVLLWDFYPQYENRAPLRENGWNHIKMVVSGRRMNVFVNDATSPTLEVGGLEGDAIKGGLRLQGPGTFRKPRHYSRCRGWSFSRAGHRSARERPWPVSQLASLRVFRAAQR